MHVRRIAVVALLSAGLMTACEERTDTGETSIGQNEPMEAPGFEEPIDPANQDEREQAVVEPTTPSEVQPRELPEQAQADEPPQAQPGEAFVRQTVTGEFDEVVDRLDDAVGEHEGMEVATVFKVDRMADEADTKIGKTHVFAISNPDILTPLVQQTPEIALDLPLKVLVYEQDGQTHIVREKIEEIASRHQIEPTDANLQKMSEAMNAIVASAAGQQGRSGTEKIEQEAVLGEGEMRDY